jgi:hypothetical protein
VYLVGSNKSCAWSNRAFSDHARPPTLRRHSGRESDPAPLALVQARLVSLRIETTSSWTTGHGRPRWSPGLSGRRARGPRARPP